MEPVPDAEITQQDWDRDEKLKGVFADLLRNPVMRTALALWKERFRCVHGQQMPTLIAGLDPIQSSAALNNFREGANFAIDDFIRMGRLVPRAKTPTNDPRHFGEYQLQPELPPEQAK